MKAEWNEALSSHSLIMPSLRHLVQMVMLVDYSGWRGWTKGISETFHRFAVIAEERGVDDDGVEEHSGSGKAL